MFRSHVGSRLRSLTHSLISNRITVIPDRGTVILDRAAVMHVTRTSHCYATVISDRAIDTPDRTTVISGRATVTSDRDSIIPDQTNGIPD